MGKCLVWFPYNFIFKSFFPTLVDEIETASPVFLVVQVDKVSECILYVCLLVFLSKYVASQSNHSPSSWLCLLFLCVTVILLMLYGPDLTLSVVVHLCVLPLSVTNKKMEGK